MPPYRHRIEVGGIATIGLILLGLTALLVLAVQVKMGDTANAHYLYWFSALLVGGFFAGLIYAELLLAMQLVARLSQGLM